MSTQRLSSFLSLLDSELCSITDRSPEVQYAVNRQKERARKRAQLNTPGLKNKAIKDFLAINSVVGNIQVALDPYILSNARWFLYNVLARYTTSLSEDSVCSTLDLDECLDLWRFGPGASNGIRGSHFATKVIQTMTCTASAIPFVRLLRRSNSYMAQFDSGRALNYKIVEGSRLSTVPKNEDTERTIAIEPLGNMAWQLAAGSYLEGALRSIGLDISTQESKNKILARRGSIDGSLATIDLSSASDMFSLRLCKDLLPPDWYDFLCTIRSPFCLIEGQQIKLNMMSTMGNGFTFPLMTLLIVSLLYGYRASKGGPSLWVDWCQAGVYGDDIIIKSSEYTGFTEVLRSAGLIVNDKKSYATGPFRESCGGDYFEGYDVTPFYAKSLSTDHEVYIVINQLVNWCATHQVWCHRSLGLLFSYLNQGPYFVPEWHNPDEGVLISQVSARYKYLSRRASPKKLRSSLFDCMLAVGGYIQQMGPSLTFLPRESRMKSQTRRARLPQGYLSGWDPLTRSQRLSTIACDFIQAVV